MSTYATVDVVGEELHLLPEKAVYWPRRKCLFIADLHLGKVSHFRKHGIAVPMDVQRSNEDNLLLLLNSLDVEEVIILGDLFHSGYNAEWQVLERLTTRYLDVTFHLVEGNHDILAIDQYRSTRLVVHRETWELGPFTLSHEPLPSSRGYNLCGHIHPGVMLRGRGRQRLRLPCFYLGQSQGILPAFGAFTGLYVLSADKCERVYAIADGQVIDVSINI